MLLHALSPIGPTALVQVALLSQGLLRTDGGGPDTPYTDRMLTENFLRIAMFDEYQRSATTMVRVMGLLW